MNALLLKDLRVLRPWWWLIVPGHMLFAANGIVSPPAFFGMNVALALAYTVILLVVEWKQDADRFVAGLPVSREDIVRARYAGSLGAAVGGTVLWAVYGHVLLALATERLLARWPDTPGWESGVGLLTFFLVVWLASVAYLPFYFRFGLATGTWLFVASLAPVAAAATLVLRWRALPSTLLGLSEVAGSLVTVAGALVVAAGLGWFSLRLSVGFYDRRDL